MQENERVPLEKRTIRVKYNGVREEVPAIHRAWISQRAFPRYLRPPFREDGSLPFGAKDMWLELITLLKEDLQWLLSLPHHVFWSQILETKVAITTLTSFLQDAPPSYTQQTLPDSDMDGSLKETARLVFLVYIRLSTITESPEHFFTEKAFGEIVYEKYIFTIPSLLDLCAVYGQSNSHLVKTILERVTKAQPKYLDDLSMAHRHLVQLLDRARGMLGDGKWSGKAKNVKDVVVHVYDALTTLRIFMELFPKGCNVFASTEFFSSIATFYSAVIPDIVNCEEYVETVQNIREECIRIVRKVFEELLRKVLESHDDELAELHLSLVSEIMSEGVFVMDYHAVHPLDVELDVIGNVCPDMDHLKIDYLQEALWSHVGISPLPKKPSKNKNEENIVNYPHTTSEIAAAAASSLPSVSGVELESLITQVQDLLPHLGSAFVEACLRHYDFSTEKVLEAVLESSLPPSLEELQWGKEKSPVAATSVADEGAFDISYRGKKPKKHRNLNQLLNDKQEVKDMKDRFAAMRFVEDTTYDDEYDDTYETEDLGVREAGDDRLRRPFVTPRVLEQARRQKIEDEDEDDEEEDEDQDAKRDHFVANPAELRAKAEQKYADQRARRDVVGKPKGQGQDKQVLINRAKKQVHKSSASNHSRRDRAQRKRNQGMIPS